MASENWQVQFERWKKEKRLGPSLVEKQNQKQIIETLLPEVLKPTEPLKQEIPPKKEENITFEINLKKAGFILITLIILGLVGHLIYQAYIIDKEFNYFYDIGGIEDSKKSYLTPLSRVTSITNQTTNSSSHRNVLTNGLVYLDVPIISGADSISISMNFKDNIPKNNQVQIGVRTAEEWKYNSTRVFYQNRSETQNWIIGQANFTIKDLYIQNGKLSVLINIPHLNKNVTMNQTVAIDWINVTVKKNGEFNF
jgi:hypothetical protein